MFTGIIEEIGEVIGLETQGSNLNITIKANLSAQLKIDQSVAHDGVCLTVVEQSDEHYTIIAVEETLNRTNFSKLKVGSLVNLERGMKMNDRLDGHIVQGHVDQTAVCTDIIEKKGSHVFYFKYDSEKNNMTIEKGSITVNGVSLTVVDSLPNEFSVAIIPYTYAHTNFNNFKKDTTVNLEFDVIGKYVKRLMEPHI